jgi:hypothetical protein
VDECEKAELSLTSEVRIAGGSKGVEFGSAEIYDIESEFRWESVERWHIDIGCCRLQSEEANTGQCKSDKFEREGTNERAAAKRVSTLLRSDS